MLPRLLMPNNFCLPPVEYCRGTTPTQAAKSRPRRKAAPLPMAATVAVETRGPESVSLEAFEQFTLQKHLKHLATFLSEDRVKHARSYLKSIFAEAVEQDFLLKDPTRGIKVPRNLREKDKTTLTWHQLRAVLASVTTRDRMLLTLEMTDALRPSELFALRWRSFDGSRLKITETVYSL